MTGTHAGGVEGSDALPAPRHALAHSIDPAPTTETLVDIRGQVDHITGLLVAARDGLAVSADTQGVDNDVIAALSAAAIGLTAQFTAKAAVGAPTAAVFEGQDGYLCVFPLEPPLLLVVFGERNTTLGLFNIAAKQALSLLRQAIVRHRVHSIRATRRTYFEHEEGVPQNDESLTEVD